MRCYRRQVSKHDWEFTCRFDNDELDDEWMKSRGWEWIPFHEWKATREVAIADGNL